MSAPHLDPARKHTAVLLFDAADSNPNGDPDAGNQPRTDPETGHGLVSDVSIKRRIRDTAPAVAETLGLDLERYRLFVQAGTSLNTNLTESAKAVGRTAKKGISKKDRGPEDAAKEAAQLAWLREHFFDIRLFGGVLSTGDYPLGKLTGPVQVEWARSIDPVVTTEHTITRVARTLETDDENTQMGSKWVVPYGLYMTRIHISPHDARRAELTSHDLDVLWKSMLTMFDHTRSASRPNVGTVGLWVFSDRSPLGSQPARTIAAAVEVTKTNPTVARAFEDYIVTVREDLHENITVTPAEKLN
jgi:CRISPR-associated protein Csd2